MPLLTAAQLAELRQIIQDGATALAVTTFGDEVTPEELQRLVDEGYINPDVLDDLTLTAFEYGALLGKLPEAGQMTFPQFASYMRKDPVPLSKPEREAVELARQRAGQFCRGLGNRYSDELGRIVVNADAELAQQLREGIGGEVAEAAAERESQGMLVRRLRQMSGQMTRDWTRIANTETHVAHQEGLFETTVGRNGEGTLFAKVPEADACEDCIKHYVDRNTGKPIVRPASWWASHGSNNVGRKRAEWQPVLGAMHPWCRCQLVEVPEGFEFDEDWSLVPSEETGVAEGATPVEKSQKAPPGEVHTWADGKRHRKRADGEWEEVPEGRQLGLFEHAAHRVTETDQQPVTRTHPPVKIPAQVRNALERGGYLVINSSGGKDSQAITYALATHPELQRYHDHIIVLHADLGRGEWPGSMQHAQKVAEAAGLRFEVARRDAKVNPVTNKREPWEGDMLTHFEERAAWPSSCSRFCTSDLKTGPLWKWMRQNLADKGVPVISALGIRKQEGEDDKTSGKSRWFAEEVGASDQMGKEKGETREAWEWNPILDWKVEDVWAAIQESGVGRHYAYDLGMSRLSCMFCVLASKPDLLASARANPERLEEWIATEQKMRANHEERRKLFADAIAKAQLEGKISGGEGDDLLLLGQGDNTALLEAGGKRKGADLLVPKRYLRPFLEFHQGKKGEGGWTLEKLRAEAIAKGDHRLAAEIDRLVDAHAQGMRRYARLVDIVVRLQEQAVAEDDPDRRAGLWLKRQQAMEALASAGRQLVGSHPFPTRSGVDETFKSLGLEKARRLHGRRTFQGFEVSIENRAGSCRHWYDRATQTEGQTKMLYPYGYIRRTMGVDGDHVDVFLGPDESSQTVYVIHQMKAPSFDTFDEDKVMLGFPNGLEARRAYRDHYDDPRFFGGMTPMSLDEFRRKVYATADKPEMIKAKGEGQLSLFRPAASGPFIGPRGGKWADAKHTRHWEPPELAETSRGRAALGAPVPALTTVFVNASGGAEKKRFRASAAHLAQSNVGIQIVAHEIPRQAKALDVYAKATHHGLHIMVDSGEAGRFTAHGKAAKAAEKAQAKPDDAELAAKAKKAQAKADKLEAGFNFDAIYDRCEALAKVAAPGTLQVVAPDRIAEPDATAHLRQQYAPRIRKLQEMGVQIIAPIQARDPEGMAKDYIAISEAFGDDVILGFPSAKAPVPMADILPFAVQLYSAGKYPKLHFLGATEPAKLAERSAQLVAAAYFTSRGLPRERVLELCATPREAARALRNVKTQDDVLSRESDHLLWAEMTGWAREQGMDPDSEDFDETEAWPEFYREHPEEYDLSIRGAQDKETIFRELAAKLSQSDSQAVGMVQRVGREHDIVTGRQHAHGEAIEAVPKVERFIPLLDRYLQAKEHQGERLTPTARSGFEALFGKYAKSLFADATAFAKAEFSGSSGNYIPRVTGTVAGMGQHSDPARTPGDNVLNRDPVTEWPPFLDRPIRRRRKLQRAAERYDVRGRHKSDGGWANPPRNEQVQAERGEVDKDIARAAASGHRYREELEERQRQRVALRGSAKLEGDLQDYHRGSKT